MKTITYDDTRDCAIRIIEKLNALEVLPDTIFDEDIYFNIQDTITEEKTQANFSDIEKCFEEVTTFCTTLKTQVDTFGQKITTLETELAAEKQAFAAFKTTVEGQPNEFSGNTFTISNLGMMDIDEFTAIINPPDSCIMAVGRIKEIVVKKADGFGTSNVMKVTMSCDHRSVDGALGAAFLQTFKKYLENPITMLL